MQLLSGSGGWPSTLLLTPELFPFFAGTYFPPRDTVNSPDLLTLLRKFSRKWNESKDVLVMQADELVSFIQKIYCEQAVNS